MALSINFTQPPTSFEFVDDDRRLVLPWALYLPQLDALVRVLASANVGTLVSVSVPNNANAAAAGVPVGGLYCGTLDPRIVYVRTA
jgi:hypothetical protein